ncbi:hypothetical protein CR513_19212, partial [Mucuna pruriens]
MDKNIIDAASGGALMDKTLRSHPIESGKRSWHNRQPEVGEATNRVNIIGEAAHCQTTSIGRTVEMEHPIDMCPTFQETEPDSAECVGAIGSTIGKSTFDGKVDEISTKLKRHGARFKNAARVPLPIPAWTIPTRRSKTNEDVLKMFRRVEINIPFFDAIKQIPKYAKFLKELCIHKRKKLKGGVETRGIVSALTKHEDVTTRSKQVWPKKCRNPGIFSVPCTIGGCTFTDAMLELGASINVMLASIYKSLNFGDL